MALINLFRKKNRVPAEEERETGTADNNKTPPPPPNSKGGGFLHRRSKEEPERESSTRSDGPPVAASVSSCGDSDVAAGDASVQSQGSLGSSKKSSPGTPRTNRKEYRHYPSSRHSTSSAIGLDEVIEDRREAGQLIQNVVHIEFPCGKPIEEVYDGVHDGPLLGSGISGEVKLVQHKATGMKYACKVLDLELVQNPMQLKDEILIMSKLDHPNIVRLEEVYESSTAIYLVQELCIGGELFDRLEEQEDWHYSEAECARLVKQMLCAVRYLHSKGIVHRDLKLENFLFTTRNETSELKLIDFGLSKYFQNGEVLNDQVGTPYTVAPEVIRGRYGELCDIWAIGVIAFLLLSGVPPFGGCGGPESLPTVRNNILTGNYAFEPAEIWQQVSETAKHFIRKLLVIDPSERPTAAEAQQHEWIQEWVKKNSSTDRALSPNVVKSLVNFKGYSDMRKLLHEVLSFTLLPEQITDLRLEFEKMDTEGTGEISLDALKTVLMGNNSLTQGVRFTEKEVIDIFDSMRVHKTEESVHWHEFIAAGLSQCPVDDRNLRLAFDRLDSDHKGLITLEDIKDLMGSDAPQSEQQLRDLWGNSTKGAKLQEDGITYDDFLSLMNGDDQRKPVLVSKSKPKLGRSSSNLQAVPEYTGERSMGDVPPNTVSIPAPSGLTSTCSGVSLLEDPVAGKKGAESQSEVDMERQFSLLKAALSIGLCSG